MRAVTAIDTARATPLPWATAALGADDDQVLAIFTRHAAWDSSEPLDPGGDGNRY
jgi:hypothetical protein